MFRWGGGRSPHGTMQSHRRKNIVKLIDSLTFHRDATVCTAQYCWIQNHSWLYGRSSKQSLGKCHLITPYYNIQQQSFIEDEFQFISNFNIKSQDPLRGILIPQYNSYKYAKNNSQLVKARTNHFMLLGNGVLIFAQRW